MTELGQRTYRTAAWRKVRLVVLERDGGQCRIRGPRCTHVATDVDHIQPLAHGGDPFHLSNLRSACRECNGWLAALQTHAKRRANDNRRAW